MDEYLQQFLQPFEHLKIPLEEITSATNNFNNENCIGGGGFGKVYKGEASHSKGQSLVAIKRLDPTHGQGMPEFNKEITMLSDYKHENLISLLGFCSERNEMILVYEYASRGSLDNHLNSPHLTWTQRIKICLDVAKGLSYLHDPKKTHQRLIHCDMKSGNILLDDQWKAKVADFGLAIMGPANELHSVIITHAAGTPGYIDPQYRMTHTLTKESDVYSFGVVLFEVLCGRLCCTYRNGRVQQNFVPNWIESYKQKNLNDIMFKDPSVQPLCQSSLKTFTDIAYRCLNVSRKDRPHMAEVVVELEAALKHQEVSDRLLYFDYEKMVEAAEPHLNYSSIAELKKLLSKGIFLNGGKTWFSLNKKGEHCEMISFVECMDSGSSGFESTWSSKHHSRFSVGSYPYTESDKDIRFGTDSILKTRVKTQFLSPGVTYTVNLVLYRDRSITTDTFKFAIRYKLPGDTETSISYLAYIREDGYWMCELYQFTSDQRSVDLEILFMGYNDDTVDSKYLEGIEFSPSEKVEHKDEKHLLLDTDAKWEENLQADYEDMMKWSMDSVHWTTKKEAYSIIRKGFLINDAQKWFSLDKNGKKCHMISGRSLGLDADTRHLPDSRFREVIELYSFSAYHGIKSKIESQLISSETTYATYLVYKLPNDQSTFMGPVVVQMPDTSDDNSHIYLRSPQTPVIKPKADQTRTLYSMIVGWNNPKLTSDTRILGHTPQSRPKLKGLPIQRDDGWMEVQIWEFRTGAATETIPMRVQFFPFGFESLEGLVLEGFEFRPI